jgi:pilus assembly protein CpaE
MKYLRMSATAAPPVTWKPLVLCPNAELARRMRSALTEIGIPDAERAAGYPAPGEIPAAVRQSCNIAFLDVTSNEDRALPLIAELCGSMPVVALHARNDADLILRCLRRGASEFLSDPAAEPVRTVLERLAHAHTPQTPGRAGAVYCVVPGKPGCGASTIAAHVALHMRSGDSKVLLVDTDPLAASVGFMLKLKAEFHLGDVLRDWKRMDDDLWGRLTVPFSGIDVVLAPEAPAARFEIARPLAAELLAYWKARYDAVVLDAPDLRAADETGFAALADLVLLVTTNELAALHATRRAIEFLAHTPADRARLRLLVNRFTPATGLKRDDLKTALQMEPFAVLSNDYDLMQDALLDGKPVSSKSRFRSGIHTLCEQLQGRAAEPKSGRSFFRF